MTRLILVRHAEAEGNINRRFHGQTDSQLTENGHKQAEKLAERLANEPIDVLYSSDLSRALQTAKHIGQVKNMDVHIIKGLREIDGGEWEDVPWADLPDKFPEIYDHWENNPHLVKMPNGESMLEAQKRIIKEIGEIVKKHEGSNICIATHGTVLKAYLCYVYDKSLEELNNIVWFDNASITIIELNDEGYHFVAEGDNEHLGELSTLAKQDWWKQQKNS